MVITNLFCLVVSSVKVLSILQMFDSIGSQVILVSASLRDIVGFLLFLFLFILSISAFYKLVGATFDTGDYQEVSTFFVYLMQSTRNSIGDISVPKYAYWEKRLDDGKNDIFATGMIFLIWVIFYVINVIVLLVCLMNFLIAIVSETYAQVVARELNNVYGQRAYLNQEFIEIFGEQVFADQFSIILMVRTVEAGEDQGVMSLIKDMNKTFSHTLDSQESENSKKLALIQKTSMQAKEDLY